MTSAVVKMVAAVVDVIPPAEVQDAFTHAHDVNINHAGNSGVILTSVIF
jgi:hypothetical protein